MSNEDDNIDDFSDDEMDPDDSVVNISSVIEANKLVVYPAKLINMLSTKWGSVFNKHIQKHPEARKITVDLDTIFSKNCYGVKFTSTEFNYYRHSKMYELTTQPMMRQDILSFTTPQKQLQIIVRDSNVKALFRKYFAHINDIRFCSSCGNLAHSLHYYNDLDCCECCLIEEISATTKKEKHECPICLEEVKCPYKTVCNHLFHRKCLANIDTKRGLRCPVCRDPLNPHHYMY